MTLLKRNFLSNRDCRGVDAAHREREKHQADFIGYSHRELGITPECIRRITQKPTSITGGFALGGGDAGKVKRHSL